MIIILDQLIFVKRNISCYYTLQDVLSLTKALNPKDPNLQAFVSAINSALDSGKMAFSPNAILGVFD